MAQKFGAKTLILPRANGQFVDAQGSDVKLDQFRVIWFHEGDAADALGLLDEASLGALRGYVEQGHAMFLSGAALAMVHRLGWESTKPRLAQPGNDRYVAGLIPQVEHPLFLGLTKSGVEGASTRVPAGTHVSTLC